MTTKFISLATGIVLLDVYLRSQLYSSDPLFLFASSNTFLNAGLLILVALTIGVSFKNRFRHWWSYAACTAGAVIFGTIGILGTFFGDLLYWFPQFLQLIDSMFLLEAGVVFGISALSYKHAKAPFKFKLRWPKPAAKIPGFAFSVPKALQSPNIFRSGDAV